MLRSEEIQEVCHGGDWMTDTTNFVQTAMDADFSKVEALSRTRQFVHAEDGERGLTGRGMKGRIKKKEALFSGLI